MQKVDFRRIKQICDIVGSTIGPDGRNVLIYRDGLPVITNDGATIAASFSGKEADILKGASSTTDKEVGDGTTTTLVILRSLLKWRFLNPIKLRNGLKESVKRVHACLDSQVNKNFSLFDVAMTSTGQEELAKLVADAYKKVDFVTCEESEITEVDITNGIRMGGSPSPLLNGKYSDVLYFYKEQVNLDEFVSFLNQGVKEDKPVLVVSDKFNEAVLQTAVLNKLRRNMRILLIEEETDLLDDRGYLKSVMVDETKSELVGLDVGERIKRLKELGKEDEVARLSGKVAVIKVGGKTDVDRMERFKRVEDAVNSCKQALKDGVVPGGGKALLKFKPKTFYDFILWLAVRRPHRLILKNSGKLSAKYPDGVVDSVNVIKEAVSNAVSIATSILTIKYTEEVLH
jgi:chaperonin GroEL